MARTLRLFAPRRRTLGPLLLILLVLVVVVPVILSVTWAVTETALRSVSSPSFCARCHTMGPMVAAYEEDVHGGHSEHGVQAICTDCHAPHDSAFAFVWTVARDRVHETWVQLTRDVERIDWEAMRESRERFVYDSGCVACHGNIEDTTRASVKASVAHKRFFRGDAGESCVGCHRHVGHRNLGAFLGES